MSPSSSYSSCFPSLSDYLHDIRYARSNNSTGNLFIPIHPSNRLKKTNPSHLFYLLISLSPPPFQKPSPACRRNWTSPWSSSLSSSRCSPSVTAFDCSAGAGDGDSSRRCCENCSWKRRRGRRRKRTIWRTPIHTQRAQRCSWEMCRCATKSTGSRQCFPSMAPPLRFRRSAHRSAPGTRLRTRQRPWISPTTMQG